MNSTPEGVENTFRLTDLAPAGWFRSPDQSSVWIAGYRAFRVPKEMLNKGPKIIDLAHLRAILIFGKLTYQDTSEVEIELLTETNWRVNANKLQQRETPEGAYLLMMCPFDRDGISGNEPSTRQTIAVYVGLFTALFSRNIVYRRLFDNIVRCDTGQVSSFSPTLENPMSFAAPLVDDPHLNSVRNASNAIAALPHKDKNRIELSLRWLESATYDSGVDAFLKYWIALETIGMPDTTNIRPLNESLATAYGVSFQGARDKFALGKLFGLRSRIVHDGLIIPVYGQLLEYTQAIYTDILRHHLGLSCVRKAEGVVSAPTFNLSTYLPSI